MAEHVEYLCGVDSRDNITLRNCPAEPMPSILHITDTHLHASPEGVVSGWRTQASLDAVLRHAERNVGGFDAILVTGDLVHDECRAGYERLARQLAGLGAPVCMLPGNHDNPRVMESCLRTGNIHLLSPLALAGWRVIPLNSHVVDQVWGRLGAAQMRALEEELIACRQDVLLAVHHPPVAVGRPWMYRMRLVDGEELMRVCGNHPRVRGVVFGHIHQAFEAHRGSTRLYATPSTGRQFRPGSGEFVE